MTSTPRALALGIAIAFLATPSFAGTSTPPAATTTLPAPRAVPATQIALGALSANATTYLRFTNGGASAGTASVTLYSASTGLELGTYNSTSIPALGSLQVDLATIVAGATPTITASQTSGGVTAAVRATFRGNVQTFAVTNGVLSNLSTCPGVDSVIGGVPGPDSVDLAGVVRVFNAGPKAGTATLTLYKSADGAKVGTWTSPSIPAHGSVTVATTGLFAAINLAAGTTVPSLTLQAGRLNPGLQLDVFAQPKAGGPATNLEPRCALAGGIGTSRSAAEGAESPDDAHSTP